MTVKWNAVKKWISILLVITIFMSMFSVHREETVIFAVPRTLRISQAKNLGLSNSAAYRKIKNKIELKKVSYKQAVKSLKLKKKNMSTFRWTPLLSFKFPEKADLMDESEFVYKPMQIQNEITDLKHELNDTKLKVYEEVGNLYTEIYGYQKRIEFQEEQLTGLQETLKKNENRVLLGLGSKEDVEKIKQNIETIETLLASDMKKFINAKQTLSDLISLDVTTNYKFENPYLDSELPRTELDNFVKYTLENDHSYYSAKLDTALGLLLLNTNYDLMKKQYGGKMSYISSYVQQVKNGEKLDGAAFKSSYDKFLVEIDKPWTGKKRILFIRVPREWFKGAIDGVRYIEDEPYGLYETALEYQELLADEKTLAKEIEKQVRADYETLVNARTSYLQMQKQVEQEEELVNKNLILNALGECTFEEYTDAKEQYEELQTDALEALQVYTTLLYSYDRLTCGVASAYMSGQDLSLEGATGGNSYVVDEETDEALYYIDLIIEDNMFEFGIYLPEDFETEITHYELWADGYQIGERTEIDKKIRHLLISTQDVDNFTVKVYEDDSFIDECKIDTQVYQGPIKIVTGYTITLEQTEDEIGTYTVEQTGNTGMSKIILSIVPEEGVVYYTLTNQDGKNILQNDVISITEGFSYLSLITGNLSGITIKCYDENKEFLYDAFFKTSDFSIHKKIEG